MICLDLDTIQGPRLRSLLGLSDEQIGEVLSELLRVLDASEGKSTVALTYPAGSDTVLRT